MKGLNIKTNYHFLLFHFVDSTSLWSRYIRPKIHGFLVNEWQINGSDQEKLEEYRAEREKLGYKHEAALFAWAYSGFTGKPEYDKLLSPIRHFEKLENQMGVSIQSFLKSKLPEVEEQKLEIEGELENIDIEDTIQAVAEIFGYNSTIDRTVNAYLAHPIVHDVTGGGASGGDIHLEISPDAKNSVRVLIHEYIHIRIPTRKLLSQRDGFYRQENTKFYKGPISSVLDEAITYCLSDVILFQNYPIDERIETYKKMGNERGTEIHYIWRVVKIIEPVLRQYLDHKFPAHEAYDKIDIAFKDFVAKNC